MITLVFLWHMHQPDYRLPGGDYLLMPWVRLHAAKGYADLVNVLTRYEGAHCVVNFSGILLNQLESYYTGQSADYHQLITAKPAADLTQEEREYVIRHFFSANRETQIRPHARYRELAIKRQSLLQRSSYGEASKQFSTNELTDILVWFNLAWIGFAGQKRNDVIELVARSRDFSYEDQQQIISIYREMLSEVILSYQALAAEKRIELSFTPYHHPILPLLIDLAGEGYISDQNPLPGFSYPQDGEEHVRRGIEQFKSSFGASPIGSWPAEGSVSDAALAAFAQAGIQWVATDQQNLPTQQAVALQHLTPWRWQRDHLSIDILFRDTRLSDNISFEYAHWQPRSAAEHLLGMIHAMADEAPQSEPVITVALDGENPWENYPDGGESFLCYLFEQIENDASLNCACPNDFLPTRELPVCDHISSGSWISGNFNIWTRHPETRVAWQRLARCRKELDDVCRDSVLDQILAAEGSDWFWWFGDDFQSNDDTQFDKLFRMHLIAAYEAAQRSVPDEMHVPIASERITEARAEITGLIQPCLDGRITHFYEWSGAVCVCGDPGQASMARGSEQIVSKLWYGFNESTLFIRLDPKREWLENMLSAEGRLQVNLVQEEHEVNRGFKIGSQAEQSAKAGRMAVCQIIELALELDSMGLKRGSWAYLWVEIATDGIFSRFPSSGSIPVMIIPIDYDLYHWTV